MPRGVQRGNDVAVRAHNEGVRVGSRNPGVKHASFTVAERSYRHRKLLSRKRPRGAAFGRNEQREFVAADQIQRRDPPAAVLDPAVRQPAAWLAQGV